MENSDSFSENPQSFSGKRDRLFTLSAPYFTVKDVLRFLGDQTGAEEVEVKWQVDWSETRGGQRILISRQSCHLGGKRFWLICPRCGRCRYKLYMVPQLTGFACRVCHKLKYVSKTLSRPSYLAHHYEKMASALDRRPGPKPQRYWRYLDRREEFDALRVARIIKKWKF